MRRSTLVRGVSIVWTGVRYIQVTVRQNVVLPADFSVGIEVEATVLYPCGDDDIVGNKARHLTLEHSRVSGDYVFIVNLSRILLIDNYSDAEGESFKIMV